MDGLRTAQLLAEVLDLDELPTCDQAIEIEQRLFTHLCNRIKELAIQNYDLRQEIAWYTRDARDNCNWE